MEKVTGATVNINRETTPHSQQKEKEKLDKECPSKDNMTKEKESLTVSQQDKEKDMSFVTSVDNQVTQWRTAEFQYTASANVHRTVIRMWTQHNSGTKHPTTMIHTGGTMINQHHISHSKW